MVNTCGFVEAAKKDSHRRRCSARPSRRRARSSAVGCLAERYGKELAAALPEADAVLGFDDYADIAARLRRLLAGQRSRRTPRATGARCCRSAPSTGPPAAGRPGPSMPRLTCRPTSRPSPGRARCAAGSTTARSAPLKLASGCDRRCSFCAIPSFRGSFVSRPPADVLAEAALAGRARACASCSWSARTPPPTARTSATCGCWRRCCPQLAAVDGIERVRVSYLQPAEMRPVAGRGARRHAGRGAVLRPVVPARQRRRCCGGCGGSATGALPRAARPASARWRPAAGVRSNVIVGFPGETEADLAELRAVPVARRGWTPSASSATPTRTAPRPVAARQARRGRVARRVERGQPTWPRS